MSEPTPLERLGADPVWGDAGAAECFTSADVERLLDLARELREAAEHRALPSLVRHARATGDEGLMLLLAQWDDPLAAAPLAELFDACVDAAQEAPSRAFLAARAFIALEPATLAERLEPYRIANPRHPALELVFATLAHDLQGEARFVGRVAGIEAVALGLMEGAGGALLASIVDVLACRHEERALEPLVKATASGRLDVDSAVRALERYDAAVALGPARRLARALTAKPAKRVARRLVRELERLVDGPPPAEPRYPRAEVARSGRARCLHCGAPIDKQSLRVAVEEERTTRWGSVTAVRFVHLGCARAALPGQRVGPLLDASVGLDDEQRLEVARVLGVALSSEPC